MKAIKLYNALLKNQGVCPDTKINFELKVNPNKLHLHWDSKNGMAAIPFYYQTPDIKQSVPFKVMYHPKEDYHFFIAAESYILTDPQNYAKMEEYLNKFGKPELFFQHVLNKAVPTLGKYTKILKKNFNIRFKKGEQDKIEGFRFFIEEDFHSEEPTLRRILYEDIDGLVALCNAVDNTVTNMQFKKEMPTSGNSGYA